MVSYLTLVREDALQRQHSLRALFNTLRYVVRYGIAWRAMPNDLPPWAAVYQQTQRWLQAGCFEALVHDLRAVLRMASGRPPEPTAVIIDSRTLRSTPESGTRAGYDGAKSKRGSKLHMAVDTLGHLLALHVSPANHDDRAEVGRLAEAIQIATDQSVERAYVDRGYTGDRPVRPQGTRGSRSRWSGCRRPSAGSCCCRDAGWSSGHSREQPNAVVSSRTMSAMLPLSQVCTSSHLHVSQEGRLLYSRQVKNTT